MLTSHKHSFSLHTFQQSYLFPLFACYLLTCLVSWLIWLPPVFGLPVPNLLMLLAGLAPSIGGAVFLLRERGSAGRKELIDRLTFWYVHPKWYLVAVMGPMLVFLLSVAVTWAVQGSLPRNIDPAHVVRSWKDWNLVPVVFLYVFVFTALGEEIGWRGYALPRLLAQFGKLRASLLVGAAWGLWHLPLFWIPGNFHQQIPFTWFLLQILASSILYTWIYQHTRGSLLLAMLFHAGSNTAFGLLPVLPADAGGSTLVLWTSLLFEIAAAVLVLRFDPEMR